MCLNIAAHDLLGRDQVKKEEMDDMNPVKE